MFALIQQFQQVLRPFPSAPGVPLQKPVFSVFLVWHSPVYFQSSTSRFCILFLFKFFLPFSGVSKSFGDFDNLPFQKLLHAIISHLAYQFPLTRLLASSIERLQLYDFENLGTPEGNHGGNVSPGLTIPDQVRSVTLTFLTMPLPLSVSSLAISFLSSFLANSARHIAQQKQGSLVRFPSIESYRSSSEQLPSDPDPDSHGAGRSALAGT